MEKLADSIDFAEQQVAARKQVALGELHAVEAKTRRAVTSPKVIAGVLVGAIVLAYLMASRKPKEKESAKPGPLWRQFMPLLQVVLPMVGAAMGKKAEAPPKKKVVVVQNPPAKSV